MQTHPWPGNVDQLRSVVEQAILYTDERRLGPAAFAELLEEPADAGTQHNQSQDERQSRDERVNQHESVPSIEVVDGKWRTLAQIEADHIRVTLIEARYNQVAAARMLSIPLQELIAKIARYRIPLKHCDRDTQGV